MNKIYLVSILLSFLLSGLTPHAVQASGRPHDPADEMAQLQGPLDGLQDFSGVNYFSSGSGNLQSSVVDLTVFDSQCPLVFSRHINSRFRHHPGTTFGSALHWRHNLEFVLIKLRRTHHLHPVLLLCYPDGKQLRFQATNALGEEFAASVGHGARLYPWKPKWSQDNGYTLVDPKTQNEYYFERDPLHHSNRYRLIQVRQASNAQSVFLHYDPSYGVLNKIIAPSGRSLLMTYHHPEGEPPRLKQVIASDGRKVDYLYEKWGVNQQWVLSQVNYPENIQAHYTYVSSLPAGDDQSEARPLLATSLSPMTGLGPNKSSWAMRYYYNYEPGFGVGRSLEFLAQGILKSEHHYFDDQPFASLPYGAGQESYALDAKGAGTHRIFSLGRLMQRLTASGAKTIFFYEQGGNGYLKKVIRPNNATKSYERDSMGRALSETNEIGQTTHYTYNERGFLMSATDVYGNVTTIHRNAEDLMTLKIYPGGGKEEWTYDENHWLVTHRLRSGGKMHYTYYEQSSLDGKRGDVKSVSSPDGATTTFTYYPSGKVKTVTNALGHTTSYEYNARGLTTLIAHSDATTKSYAYDDRGNLTTLTDEEGHTTYQLYDTYNRRTKIINALGEETTFTYGDKPDCNCPLSMVATITEPAGSVTAYTYDEVNNRTSETRAYGTPEAATTTYGYDKMKRRISTTDSMGNTTWRVYDALGRAISLTDPLGNVTTITYDSNQPLKTLTYPDGSQETERYNAEGQVIERINRAGEITKVTYNLAGQQIAITDPRGLEFHFDYDLLGRETRFTYPDGSQHHLTYDPVGHVKTFTSRTGEVRTDSYNSRGRLQYSAWSAGANIPELEMIYDKVGRPQIISNNVSQITRSYDALGRMTQETQHISGQTPRTFTYHHNSEGLQNVISPSGQKIDYTYTGHGQIDTITWEGQLAVDYDYQPDGYRKSKTLGNGALTTYHRDAKSRLLQIAHQFNLQQSAAYTYGYDLMNQRTYVERTTDLTGGGAQSEGDRYYYDANNQLTGVAYRAPQPAISPQGAQEWGQYQYDLSGNRRTSQEQGIDRVYNASPNANTYTSVGNIPIGHDQVGNLEQWGLAYYQYDAQNRLRTAGQKGGEEVALQYDGLGRCVSRSTAAGITYLYYQNGWDLSEERGVQGELLAAYVHGPGEDEILAQQRGQWKFYYHRDAGGNMVQLSDPQGLVIENYAYRVYGEVSITDWQGSPLEKSSVGNRFFYTGREWIEEIGLYDYRMRHYHPGLGRFVQHDPIGLSAKDDNLYRYVSNNPTNRSDALGLMPTAGVLEVSRLVDICEIYEAGIQGAITATMMAEHFSPPGGNIEFCGQICACPMTGEVVNSGPVAGYNRLDAKAINVSAAGGCDAANAPCEKGWNKVGIFHTHNISGGRNPYMPSSSDVAASAERNRPDFVGGIVKWDENGTIAVGAAYPHPLTDLFGNGDTAVKLEVYLEYMGYGLTPHRFCDHLNLGWDGWGNEEYFEEAKANRRR